MSAARPMRLVVVAPHFAEYATRLATALSKKADVLLVSETRNERAECEGLEIAGTDRISRKNFSGDFAQRSISLRRVLERRKVYGAIDAFAPDLIHVQEQGDVFTAAVVERYARALPVVVTVHDPMPHSGDDSASAQRFASGLIRIRAAADAYHVHGAYCEGLLRRVLGSSKPILATAHGTILEPAASQGEPAGDRYLFFGRMEAYKGIDVLLDAIDLLKDEGFRFTIAGRGTESERFRSRMAVNPAIDVLDHFLPAPDAIRQFQRARAVIVPYRDATQSGVVSAAFGNRRPVIASLVGGLVDAVEHGVNGLLVAPEDPEALAAGIRALADPSLCSRLTEGARAAAQGAFAWSAIAEQLHELYADLVGKAGGRDRFAI